MEKELYFETRQQVCLIYFFRGSDYVLCKLSFLKFCSAAAPPRKGGLGTAFCQVAKQADREQEKKLHRICSNV